MEKQIEKEFDREDLEFHLKDRFRNMSKEYMLECIYDEKIQKKWSPEVGDVMVGCTGNIFVISGKHRLVEELGGTIYMFGGHLCCREKGSCEMKSTACYLMNRKGIAPKDNRFDTFSVSSFKDFRYVPYPKS